jgi:hypothetical protein
MDFTRDDDNTLCILATKYIENLIKNYEKLFGMKPSQNVTSPLDKGDHPELDTSELCNEEQISQYQYMIGSLQWIVTIGNFDVHTVVMTMSEFCIAPRIGHIRRIQRIYGYCRKCDSRPFALEPKNRTSLIYLILSMIGLTQYTVKLRTPTKRYPRTTGQVHYTVTLCRCEPYARYYFRKISYRYSPPC